MIEHLEQQLAELRTEREDTARRLAELEPDRDKLERALSEAEQIFNAALRERLDAEAQNGDRLQEPVEGATWHQRPAVGPEEERLRQQRRDHAFGTWQAADEALRSALVNRNEHGRLCGDLQMHIRSLDSRIAQLETELQQARERQAEPRDLLSSIREWLGLGGAA